MPRHAATVARMGVGLLLLAAAVLKGHALASGPVLSSGFFSGRVFLSLVVELEGLLGLWLLSGIYSRVAARVACGVFAVFAGVSLWKAIGGAVSCGCFGKLAVNPWISFAIDLIALPTAMVAGFGPRKEGVGMGQGRWIAVAGCVGMIAGGVFLKMGIPRSGDKTEMTLTMLDATDWVGKPWPLAGYVDVAPELARGRWAVVMYSATCGHCYPMLGQYGGLARTWREAGRAMRVAMIETSGDLPPGTPAGMKDWPVLQGRFDGPREWYIVSPTLVVLVDGRVVRVGQGEEECQWEDRMMPGGVR